MREREETALWWLTAGEIAGLVALGVALTASLTGHATLPVDLSRSLRTALLAFVAVELAVPAWVYLDVRRRSGEVDPIWVHAAAMPVVNLVGLAGYLDARRRAGADDTD